MHPKISLAFAASVIFFTLPAIAADATPAAASGSASPASAAASASGAPRRPPSTATIHWTPDAPDKIVNVLATDKVETPKAITPDKPIELFNGKDFTGWEFTMRTGTTATADWSVADGVIQCVGKPNGYIRTAQAYKDYKVTVKWRFPVGKQGNTGVLVNITPPEVMAPWPKCVECQGLHDFQGDFWFWSGATCAGLDTMPVEKLRDGKKNGIARIGPSVEKPVGEWNTYAVVCAGDTVTIFVNDQQVNQITGANVSSGYIGIQSEGAGLEIRKVSLEPLPKTGAK